MPRVTKAKLSIGQLGLFISENDWARRGEAMQLLRYVTIFVICFFPLTGFCQRAIFVPPGKGITIGPSGTYQQFGDMTIGPGGSSYNFGDMTMTPNGNYYHFGDMTMGPEGTYHHFGDMTMGPGGTQFHYDDMTITPGGTYFHFGDD